MENERYIYKETVFYGRENVENDNDQKNFKKDYDIDV